MAGTRRRILYIDDDERTLNVVSRFLVSRGYEVFVSTSPFVAPVMEKEKPDLVILDLNMPLLPGDRIAEILERQGYTDAVPLLFFSSEPQEKIERVARQFGRADWLSKQSGLEQLLLKIKLLLT